MQCVSFPFPAQNILETVRDKVVWFSQTSIVYKS